MTGPDLSPVRVVYLGTPAFAVPALRVLAERDDIDVSLVVTRPDRPVGRGRRVTRTEVATAADALGMPVWQPENLRTAVARARLTAERPDLMIVAAYGQILGPKALAIPRVACLNLHASLLPHYRGASPIAAAIAAGDDRTGVSLMVMGVGLDTGPVVATADLAILADDTTASLTGRLADLAAALIDREARPYVSGDRPAVPQPPGACLTRPLVKSDGWLDWDLDAGNLERLTRAMWPWPRAWTTAAVAGDMVAIQVHAARVGPDIAGVAAGTVVMVGGELAVQTGHGSIILATIQFSSEGPKSGQDLARSGRLLPGTVLGDPSDAPPNRAPLTVPVPG